MADKYKSNDDEIVEAFQLGVEPSPKWFTHIYEHLIDANTFHGYYIVKSALYDIPMVFTERTFKQQYEPIL